MRKMNKITISLVIALSIVLGFTVLSYAEDGVTPLTVQPSQIGGNTAGNNTNTGANLNTNANNTSVNASAISTSSSYNNSVVNNTNKNNNSNLPSTGLADYTPLFVSIGALALVAVIAYRKANYYKDI